MEVEVEGEDGSKFALANDDKTSFGRGLGFNTNDRTVSRRHVSFHLTNSLEKNDAGAEPRVSFEVIGRNPIWVFSKNDGAVRVFRKFEKGEMEVGDRFCLSGKAPVWFYLKGGEVQEGKTRVLVNEDEVAEIGSSHNGFDIEDIDVSGIDPVKEFGFLVIGHEFDHYPKGMIRSVKNWDWFVEEPAKDSEDEDDFEKRTTMRGKRKKVKDNADDEWTVESEEDKDIVAKIRKVKRSGYSTRSRDQHRQTQDTKVSRNSGPKKASSGDETVEDEDDDETLGGFIVDDEEENQVEEENSEEEEEEEEEFEEEEEDDELVD
ncbi:mitotic apparatus protein p62-like [Senna tora]|uniref:Mitotic apparatus protein p62-like n=1 Tax=Senna tora TaxID=362788 RepID=A0A834W8D0_9FABA|nr:mitotic apparatus protein p62-like [Senna tora]